MALVILEAHSQTCRICMVEKPVNEFARRKERASGYRSECKQCIRAKVASWKDSNPEKLLEYKQRKRLAGYSYPVDALDRMNYNRRYYEANKELGAQVYRDRAAKWLKDNPDKSAAKKAARRFKQALASPAWANTFFISEAYHLAQLRTKMLGAPWEVDHLVPLKSRWVCGLHVEHNLAVIPARLNSSKGNRYWPDMP